MRKIGRSSRSLALAGAAATLLATSAGTAALTSSPASAASAAAVITAPRQLRHQRPGARRQPVGQVPRRPQRLHRQRHPARHLDLQCREQPGVHPHPSGEITVYGDKCLEAYEQGKTSGTIVDIYTCNGGANQLWTLG